jgi:hypothetical protein
VLKHAKKENPETSRIHQLSRVSNSDSSPFRRCAARTTGRRRGRITGTNVLELDARDIALHFGHQDGGELVRKLYGHPDARLARERIRKAFRQAPTAPVPLAPPLVPAGRYG